MVLLFVAWLCFFFRMTPGMLMGEIEVTCVAAAISNRLSSKKNADTL